MRFIPFIIIALFWTSCQSTTAKDKDVVVENNSETIRFSPEQIKMAGIEVGQLQTMPISEEIECTGRIETKPQNLASVSVPINGYVASINVHDGEFVKKGSVTVALHHPDLIDLQSDYLQTIAELGFMQKDYERQKTLRTENVGAKKNFERTEADYKKLKAQKAAFEAKLKMIGFDPARIAKNEIQEQLMVKAPIAGYVDDLDVHIGQFVSPEHVLFHIVNPRDYLIELKVFAQQKSRLKISQKLLFQSSEKSGDFEATIAAIGEQVDEDKKTVSVFAKPVDSNLALTNGSFVHAKIQLNSEKLTVLPDAAVILGDKPIVFIQKAEGEFIPQEVEVGIVQNGFVHIKNRSTLSDKQIVTKGANYLVSKM